MTQQSLAKALHVTDKAVSKWERGLSLPDICLFSDLAGVLNVSTSDLLLECSDGETPSHLVQIYKNAADIRSPLHIILGCTDLLRKYRYNDELFTRYLESIRISGEYLLSVLEMAQTVGELQHLLREKHAPRNLADTLPDYSGKRFLVVEDMEVSREIAGELLRDTGAQVDFAEDGHDCVERLSAAPAGYYDLILMDVSMPRMDGLEATRRLRQMGVTAPIIAISANVSEQDERAALEAGMDAFTEKPIFVDRLFPAIDACLGKG
jgi:CheY-like chemotaxis protein/transcriptional regulator with XRE-family HTH domain